MNKNKFVSYLFLVLGVLVIVASTYVIYLYGTDIMTGIVEFIAKNNIDKLRTCGVVVPTQFSKMSADLPILVIPFYVGVLVFTSFLMFFSGYYYFKGKNEADAKKNEETEKEMVHRLVEQMGYTRPSRPSKPAPKAPEPEEEPEPEAEESAPEEAEESAPEEEVEEEPEEKPAPKYKPAQKTAKRR